MKSTTTFFLSMLILTILGVSSYSQMNERYWAKLYEETQSDVLHCLLPLPNGDILIGGWTNALQSQGENLLLVRINENGNIVWQKSYGEYELDYAQVMARTTNNQIVVGGHTRSFGAGSSEILLLKVNEDGDILFQKTYGTYDDDAIASVMQTDDGGFLVGGWSYIGKGRSHEALVFKTNSNGELIWHKYYGTQNYEGVRDITKTNDGNYIFVGLTSSEETQFDIWVVKFDPAGNIIWQKAFAGQGNENPVNILNFDGTYIIVGTSDSFGDGSKDIILLAINNNGELLWAYNYPDDFETTIMNAIKYKQGKILVIGSARKKNLWNNDILLGIFNSNGQFENGKLFSGVSDELGFAAIDYKNSIIAGGYSYSFSNGNSDIILIRTDDQLSLPDGEVKLYDYGLTAAPNNINFQEIITVATNDTTSLTVTEANFQVSNPNLTMRNLNVTSSVGVSDLDKDFELLPLENQFLILKVNNNLHNLTNIKILNILGEEVLSFDFNSNQQQMLIPINLLSNGFYTLKLEGINKYYPFVKY